MTRGEDSYVPSGSRATFVGRVTLTSVTNERDTKTQKRGTGKFQGHFHDVTIVEIGEVTSVTFRSSL